jgi:squalene-associated FAD-dependent desaturase
VGAPVSAPRVAVVGGGLAGITAALRAAQGGAQVTLVERRGYLGGRAYSFTDPETGVEVDNGQHVFLGCCTAFTDLLAELGTLERTWRQRRLRVQVRRPGGPTGVLSALPLPAPAHLALSLLTYPHLSWREKAAAVRALLAIRAERHRERPELADRSFGDWLRAHGQTENAIAHLWELIVLPSLNDAPDAVSASMGFMVFQEALLWNAHGADIGYAREGLSAVTGEPAAALLRQHGVSLALGRSAEGLAYDGGRVRGVRLAGGEVVDADATMLAVPAHALGPLLPTALTQDRFFAPAAALTYAPIVNLHVWYDRPVAGFDFAAFVDSPVQWVFNRSRIAGLPGPGQYLTVSLSGAHGWWPMPKEALRERLLEALAEALPAARTAQVERTVVVKEQRATFASPPGAPARLPQRTPVPGLYLAGDWTDTGWPSTMESAVRSGEQAAVAVLEDAR